MIWAQVAMNRFVSPFLCGRLTLKDEGAQDVQTASAWVVVPKDIDLSWRTSSHQQTQPIPRAQQDGRQNEDAGSGQ